MIIAQLTMKARQEKQEELLQTMLAMIEVMPGEPGCRKYQVFRNIKNPDSFSSISEWDSRNNLHLYLKSDKFSILLGTKSLLSTPMQLRILNVSCSEGIELVRSIRDKSSPIASHETAIGEK